MVEADVFCLIGTVYAAFASLSSMALYWVLEVEPGWEWLGDLLAIGWLAACMTVIAWLKIWMNKPSFSSGLSSEMASQLQLTHEHLQPAA